MGLLESIRTALGFPPGGDDGDRGTEVTIEYQPETATEAAVKGVDTGSPGESHERVEDGETASSAADLEATTPGPSGEPAAGSRDVETVSGIGSAYADRLREAGVETVADLAGSDAEELAAAIDLSPKRVERWTEAARKTRR